MGGQVIVDVFLRVRRLVVSQNQRALHIVFAHQFLDSPEWFGVSTDDYFQVRLGRGILDAFSLA